MENRPRRWNHRGPILLHAGAFSSIDAHDQAARVIASMTDTPIPRWTQYDRGGIVGIANLVDCLEPIDHRDGWRFPGQFGLKLESPMALPFRAMPGMLGLFKVQLMPHEVEIVTPWIETLSTR